MKRNFFAAAALLCVCPAATAQMSASLDPAEPGEGRYVYYTTPEEASDSLRSFRIDDIQVIANRAGDDTPVAYSDLSRKQIEEMNYGQDIPYLLTLTPSVVATSDAGAGVGYTSVRIRGIDGTRINVTSNGVPMNDPESHMLYWVNTPDIASSVEDIQVQRGVGTSTNGPGAFGGSINLKTETVALEPYAETSISYGSFNTHKEVVKVNTGLMNGRWSFGARLSNLHSDGYIDRASSDLTSWFAQGGYYGDNTVVKLVAFGGKEKTYHAWDGIGRDQLEANRHYNPCGEIWSILRDAAGKPILNEKGKRQDVLMGYYDNQVDNYIQNHYQLMFNQRISNALKFNATLHYTSGDGYYEEYKNKRSLVEYGLEPFTVINPDKVDYYTVNGDGENEVQSSNLIRRKNMLNGFGGGIFSLNYDKGPFTATLGGAINRYVGEHFGNVIWIKNYVGDLAPDHEYYRNNSDKLDGNVFLRANYEVARGLSIYTDLQYRRIHHKIHGANDKYDWGKGALQSLDVDKVYNFFNPKAGIFYQINEHHSAYASFATAHREPTRNNFTDAMNGRNPKPERLFDYEAGYTYHSRIFSAGANLYYMDYKDQLVLTGETNEIGEALSENVAKSYRMGIELTAGVQITRWLRWDLNATFSRNIIEDYTEYLDDWDNGGQVSNRLGDVTIAYSPSIIAGSLISVRFGGFGAALQTLYVGSQYVTNSMQDGVKGDGGEWETDPLKLDAYLVNNLRLDYTFNLKAMKKLAVGVSVNNIFNAKYCSNGWGYSYMYTDEDTGVRSRYNDMGYYPQATINVLANVTLRF